MSWEGFIKEIRGKAKKEGIRQAALGLNDSIPSVPYCYKGDKILENQWQKGFKKGINLYRKYFKKAKERGFQDASCGKEFRVPQVEIPNKFLSQAKEDGYEEGFRQFKNLEKKEIYD